MRVCTAVLVLRKSASVQKYDRRSKGFFSFRPGGGGCRTRILATRRAIAFLNSTRRSRIIENNNTQQHFDTALWTSVYEIAVTSAQVR